MKRVPIFLRGQYTNLCVLCSIIASFQTEVRVCILTTYFIFSTHTICITTTNFVQFLRSFPWNRVFSPLYDTTSTFIYYSQTILLSICIQPKFLLYVSNMSFVHIRSSRRSKRSTKELNRLHITWTMENLQWSQEKML